MKFQQLPAFEKHLEKASPDHLSRVYLVIAPCPFERKKICETIREALQKREKKVSVLTLDAEKWAKAVEELSMICFFDGHRMVVLDEGDKLKAAVLETLTAYVVKPSPYATFVLCAASAKPFSDMYERGKKELVVCDLSAEKPWERKDRLKTQLIKMAAKEKKTLSREAVDMLMERVGTDLAQLEQEMNKLLCYCAVRGQIGVQDVQVLCHTEKNTSTWHLAEALVWQEQVVSVDASFDSSALLPLLGVVRSHLQQGMLLAVEPGASSTFFKPQLLEKVRPAVRARGARFFKEALSIVFEVEMLAKNSSQAPSLLYEMLAAKMHLLKKS